MKAYVTTYKPGRYDETAETMVKEMDEYTQFVLRAGKRGYKAVGTSGGTVYLISDESGRNAFEICFK